MIKKLINKLKSNETLRTYIFTLISILITLTYSIFNGVLGIITSSSWNISISIYYLLLLVIKAILIYEEKTKNIKNRENKIILFSFILLLVMTLAMIIPAILMIINKREYNLGLIPAIAMAAFTTFNIILAFINYGKAKLNENNVIKQLRLVNLISILMSIIVLQNTLIIANDGNNLDMQILSSVSSFLIISFAIILIIFKLVKFIKNLNFKNK